MKLKITFRGRNLAKKIADINRQLPDDLYPIFLYSKAGKEYLYFGSDKKEANSKKLNLYFSLNDSKPCADDEDAPSDSRTYTREHISHIHRVKIDIDKGILAYEFDSDSEYLTHTYP